MKKISSVVMMALLAFGLTAESGKITLTDKKGKEKTFETISEALKAAKGSAEYKITLPKGTYEEALYYNGDAKITISGDTDAKFGSDVIIAVENNGDILKCKGSDKAIKNRCAFEFEGTGNLILENLTVHNTFRRGSREGKNTQAEALGFDSTGNLAAYNCSFKSYQDTIRTTGKSWFYGCYIEGDVDFLWMERTGKVALYENCEIRSLYDSKAGNHSTYICAPRADMAGLISKGIVIFNSNITTDEGQKTYLARTPWKEGFYNQVAYINTKGQGIADDVWYKTQIPVKNTPKTVIGWKMDKATAENLGLSLDGRDDIVDEETVLKEYSGRNVILNKQVSTSGVYKKDGKVWDVSAIVNKLGWNVTEDTSSLK